MKEVAPEFHYVRGAIQVLPKGMKEPPKWALEAARWVADNCLKAPTAEEIEEDIEGIWDETIAKYEGMVAFVTQTESDDSSDAEVNGILRRLQKTAVGLVDRDSLIALKEMDAEIDKILPALTAKELFELNERRDRGLASIVNAEGELQVLKTAQSEIYYFIWFFWPVVLGMVPTITAAKLCKWLKNEFGIHTSLKTVEIVFTKLRMASFVIEANLAT